MSRPRVLVTLTGEEAGGDPLVAVRERHLRPLLAAGLLPVLVPGTLDASAVAELAEDCVAASLPGTDYVPTRLGEDEGAARAGAEAAGLDWDPRKVRADLAVIALAWERRLPLLGACGGMQAMVVWAGGTLRTGTADELAVHERQPDTAPAELDPDSLAASVLGPRTPINSFHRQVVAEVTAPLRVSGRASDGVSEAVEAPRDAHPFWLGVQWHPELLGDARPYRALAAAAAGVTEHPRGRT